MKVVLFDVMLTNGHLNASFRIASRLKEDGFKVVYLSNSSKKEYIENAGFVVEIVRGNIFNKHLITNRTDIMSLIKSIIKDRIYHVKRRCFFVKLKEYEDLLVNKISPSLIILDAHCFTKVLIYEKYHYPIIKLNTMLCNYKRKYIPPLDVYYIPRFNVMGLILSEIFWVFSFVKNISKYLFFKIILLNQDEITNWFYYADILGFPRDNIDCFWKQKVLGLSIIGYNEVFLYPNKFDFYNLENKNSFFFNTGLNNIQLGEKFELDYVGLIHLIKSKKYENVIYCSLGTLVHQRPKRFKSFVEKIKIIADLNPSYLFILSLGGKVMYPESNRGNFMIFKYLPQVDLLKHVDMMISHGGANSLTECLLAKVPILVVRFNDWDNPGCASRVVYHKIGLSAKIHDSSKSISAKICKILIEKENIKKRIVVISKYDDKMDGYNMISSFLQNRI